ncbi:transcriptional repressor of ribose operon [Oceanobacillus iheyensis HTE831]|uniref:Catabolite control protein A n=1 Tax=Oceanobacillus iheyensis (strain DSM 14371 / CIP 107618 / JCM 11309 / KCTC 3954 / HTE831) TaxID=221109 RepID=Q8ENB0_OCEIH|nr:LacI family DNA-binding transcriptional regulator [Oceanobacillus iheyensis]BAC14533.1 transcriptional repressor of ribose operon [Oceanobacillus iheyensis HTE831]
MTVTIKDVAKEAGVSAATVSRVLNNSGYVYEDTRKAVMEAINHLQYKPNEVARSLYKRTSKLIGLVLPDITNPFFPALARGVEDKLQQLGYRVIFGNTDGDATKEMDYIDTFLQHNVVGLIASVDRLHHEVLTNLRVPVVTVDRTTEELPAVYADHKSGGRLAAEKLVRSACEKIVVLRGPQDAKPLYDRFQSATQYLSENNVSFHYLDCQLSFEDGRQKAKELFDQFPDTDGIIACNDLVAAAVLHEAVTRGISVPTDLQVIGYDNITISEIVHPSLTTIHQPTYEMGMKAAEMIIKLISKEKLNTIHEQLPVFIKERNSTVNGGI